MSEETVETGWSALLRPAWLPAVAVLVGGVLLHSMNVLMLATVLPSVVDNLGGATLMSWTSSAFLASSIVAATCTGYLTSILGARTVFCTGAAIFGLGALTCALAPTMGQVVAGRFVQGFGGGLLTAMAYVLVRSTFPENLWARGFALLSGAWSMSILVGPLVGGLFARYGDWRGAFFAVTAMAVILVVVALRALPLSRHERRQRARAGPARAADLRGDRRHVADGDRARHAGQAPAAGRRHRCPGADACRSIAAPLSRCCRPTPSRSAASTGVGLWLCLLVAIAYSPLQIFVAIFLQSLHGLDPLEAGYMVAGASFGWTGMSLIVAGTPEQRSDRLLIAGPLMMAVGLLGVALLMPLKPAPVVFPAIALVGAGIGACWAFIAQRVMSGARAGEENLAASSVATVQQTGFALGAALAGLAANAAGLSAGLTRTDVAEAAFWVPMSFVLAALAAVVAGVRLVRLRRRLS